MLNLPLQWFSIKFSIHPFSSSHRHNLSLFVSFENDPRIVVFVLLFSRHNMLSSHSSVFLHWCLNPFNVAVHKPLTGAKKSPHKHLGLKSKSFTHDESAIPTQSAFVLHSFPFAVFIQKEKKKRKQLMSIFMEGIREH